MAQSLAGALPKLEHSMLDLSKFCHFLVSLMLLHPGALSDFECLIRVGVQHVAHSNDVQVADFHEASPLSRAYQAVMQRKRAETALVFANKSTLLVVFKHRHCKVVPE